MRKKFIVLLLLIIIFVLNLPSASFADRKDSVLIVYSQTKEEQIKDVRILETLVGQFRDDYKIIEDADIGQEN
ncbi:hypothetical protein SFC02_01415 [Terribacillus goriensis]|uniref:hypothetical protein n=1 Tax=Terribacillus saccharophilus TaxID=361277 RepID=UPI003982FB23